MSQLITIKNCFSSSEKNQHSYLDTQTRSMFIINALGSTFLKFPQAKQCLHIDFVFLSRYFAQRPQTRPPMLARLMDPATPNGSIQRFDYK